MDKEDIIRMAREAGLTDGIELQREIEAVVRFANLVAAAERNRTWTQNHWTEYERSIAATEREAVLQAIEAVYMLEEDRNPMFSDGYKYALDQIETLIKARGQR
jgi:hypothetical protein